METHEGLKMKLENTFKFSFVFFNITTDFKKYLIFLILKQCIFTIEAFMIYQLYLQQPPCISLASKLYYSQSTLHTIP